MTRPIRSSEELRQASNHLFYEIWMFEALAQGIGSGIVGQGNVISNALLESFAIHVRALVGFFTRKILEKMTLLQMIFLIPQVIGGICDL